MTRTSGPEVKISNYFFGRVGFWFLVVFMKPKSIIDDIIDPGCPYLIDYAIFGKWK